MKVGKGYLSCGIDAAVPVSLIHVQGQICDEGGPLETVAKVGEYICASLRLFRG